MSVHQVTAAVNKFINDCVMFMQACFVFSTLNMLRQCSLVHSLLGKMFC